MINRLMYRNALSLLLSLLIIAPSAWALDNPKKEPAIGSSTLSKAVALKKAGQVNLAIKALNKHLQDNPQDLLGRVELAANYFLAKDYTRGGKLFKKILNDSRPPNKIKKNISLFIKQHKNSIKKYASLNKRLSKIKRSSQITAFKINQTQALLVRNIDYKKAQLYLASLYLKQYRGSEAKQLLDSMIVEILTPEEERALAQLKRYYQKNYQAHSNISFKGSFIIGHDSNIRAAGSGDLPGDFDDIATEENFDEDEFNEDEFNEDEFNEDEFNEDGFDEDGFDEDGFDEDGFDEDGFNEDGFDEDGFNEDGFDEDGFDEEYDEEYDDEYDDECDDECNEDESENNEKSGLFSRLNARIQLAYTAPVLNEGVLTHNIESTYFASVTEREYQDNDAQHRNYRVVELGASIARRSNHNSRIALPISIKSIQLNGENYARFYEGSMSYGFNINQNRISLSEKISYRDYQHYNKERENALLVKTSISINRRFNPWFSVDAKMAFTLLDTDNTPYASYDRFKTSLGITYQVSNTLSFGAGNEYQITHYNDHFNPGEEAIDACIAADLCYEENREDKFSNYYLDSQLKLSKNWSVKGRLSKSKRKTNHNRHEYSRTTISAGIYVKF